MADLNIQVLNQGFGSYLTGILPNDQAVAAGAFAYSMRQIKNIQNAKVESFSQAVFSLETNSNLLLTNGTDKPVNETLQTASFNKMGLGSGPNGTYTMSDFFGCMSGLPYPWKEFYDQVLKFAGPDTDLYTIYSQLYLAVTWEVATLTVECSESSGNFTPINITVNDPGGGYFRGGLDESTITITMSNGGTARVVPDIGIGKDPSDISTYGKIIAVELLTPGPAVLGACPAATISIPPDNGTGGWPSMNAVVKSYIDQANALLSTLAPNAKVLNEIYKVIGQQLKVEQRARYIGFAPVAIPKDFRSSPIPSTLEGFVDSIPNYAKETLPHMSAQVLENICDLNTTGGQSIIALMRSARNQAVLAEAGIPLDNTISDNLDPNVQKQLLLNGTVDEAVVGTGITPDGAGNIITQWTLPPNSVNVIGNVEINPCNNMLYDSCNETPVVPLGERQPGTVETIINSTNLDNCIVAVNSKVGTGPYINPYTDPLQSPQSGAIVATQPSTPGGLNTTAPILDPTLDKAYYASQMLCSTLTVQEAIDQVIFCNCDCWDI